MTKMHIHRLAYTLLVGSVLLLVTGSVALADGNIDPTNKWAWGTNIGWINFSPEHGGVTVYSDHLEGYAWGENIGWICLGAHTGGSPHIYANDAADNYGVNNDGVGNLSGYAWSTNAGWINFAPENGGVTIDPATGDFDGYAWGENVGWIHFQNASAVYKVTTGWRNEPPIADAGPDQDVDTLALVTLDGGASFDPDGHLPLTYLWTQAGGSPLVALSDPLAIKPTFVAPADTAVLTFTLAVTDSLGLPALVPDEVVITVQPHRVYLPLVIRH